jgi:hypothetical protein
MAEPLICPRLHLSIRCGAKRIPLIETLSENIGMFVSRTRNSGMPCRSPLFGGWQKTSSATICTISVSRFAVQHHPCFSRKGTESESEASFYIDDAEEGECPFLCTPSPETRRYSQTG